MHENMLVIVVVSVYCGVELQTCFSVAVCISGFT